jgi:hypothetical protein
MVCAFGTNVVACGPPAGVYQRTMRECGECKRRHRFIERWDGAWYGSTFYGGCGDTWMDGEMLRRPGHKGWRKGAREGFRIMWANAAPADLFNAYADADTRIACAQTDEQASQAIDDREAAHAAILATRKAD